MQNTKDKILDSVISFLKEENSLRQVSISQIAKRAGIGKSTTYDYFENKESLIEESYLYLLNKYKKIILQDINLSSFEQAMILQLSLILEVVEDAKIIMEAIMAGQNEMLLLNYSRCTTKIKDIQNDMEIRFREIFQLAVDEKIIKSSNKPYAPNIIQSIISGLMFQYIDGKIDIKRQDLLRLIYQEVVNTLK